LNEFRIRMIWRFRIVIESIEMKQHIISIRKLFFVVFAFSVFCFTLVPI
jgi:hypothetical protein